jgi:hypothetical protein
VAPDRLFVLLIALLRAYPDTLTGRGDLVHVVVTCCDPAQLYQLACLATLGQLRLAGEHPADLIRVSDAFATRKVISRWFFVADASLEWEVFEQLCMWRLLAAEFAVRPPEVCPLLPTVSRSLAHAQRAQVEKWLGAAVTGLDPATHTEALSGLLLVLGRVPASPAVRSDRAVDLSCSACGWWC